MQEALAKRDALADLTDVQWHLIGPLQSNKTRDVARCFDWVETLDRVKIAQRLSAQRLPGMAPLDVLIEVNVSDETTKGGVPPDGVLPLARAIAALPNLALRGIMGIPAPTTDGALSRVQFRALSACFIALQDAGFAVDTLSMGMSADLEAAIAEGATQVRIGTAIFGART